MTSQFPPDAGGDEFGNMPPYAGGPAAPPRNGLPIAALVLGIVSILGALVIPLVGVICGILAIIFGIIGMRQARAGRSNRRGFALTGLITGILGLVLAVLVGAYNLRRLEDACRNHIGHRPSSQELQQCIRDGV